jgi:hypothetical protein
MLVHLKKIAAKDLTAPFDSNNALSDAADRRPSDALAAYSYTFDPPDDVSTGKRITCRAEQGGYHAIGSGPTKDHAREA